MSISSRFVVQFSIALTAIGFLALFAIMGMTIWLGSRAQVYFDEVIEARDTRASAVELRNAVQLAESSQRGFMVTGNEIYLAPYSTARSLAYRQLEEVEGNLAPYEEMGPALQRMSAIVSEKFKEMDQTIALKRARKDAEALAAFRTNRGKALMDEANVFFSAVIKRADDRLTAGVSEQRTNAAMLRWVSIIASIVITIVVGGVIVTVLRYTRDLAQARDQLGLMNTSLEERVRVRTADLAQANNEIQRFAYIVTHDLRAPLVNIMGFTSELEGSVKSLQALIDKSKSRHDPDDPLVKDAEVATVDLAEAIGFIRSSTKKMDNLINAILKLSREGRRQLQPEQIDLPGIIKTSAAAVQHQLLAANGEIQEELDVTSFASDRLSLEQVFGNLFDNAVKYRSSNRALRIVVRSRLETPEKIALDVQDNGRGIADQDLERVFELFRRAGVQDQPGEGIGLAQVRTIIRNLGGDITVTSALDKGTNFHIVLPRQLTFTGSSASMSKDAKPVTIVMVEDDEGHARLIEKNIRRAGVNNDLIAFVNGASALEYLLGPDGSGEVSSRRQLLVLLDLNLPDMAGVDILAKIKNNMHLKRTPVVVLTTTDDSREIQNCYDLGANVYITKPVNYDGFSNAIRQLGLFFSVIQVPENA